MKISTTVNQLTGCLEIVEKALPVRSTIPVINNILLEISQNKLIFSSTNLEMFIKVHLDHESSENGKILLPPKIVDIMRSLPPNEVNIDINFDNYNINIYCGSANFNLYGSNPEDYPVSFDSQINEVSGFTINKKALKKILRMIVFAASNEETRPAFNGIFFSFKENILSLTSSDTYRLAYKEVKDDAWLFEEDRCLVPARSLRELLRILDDTDGDIKMFHHSNLITFQFNGIYFASRLLEEKYPDVSGVIPGEYKTRIVIDRKKLEDTINRAALLAEGKNQAVNILIREKQFEATVMSPEGSMEEKIPVEREGEDLDLFVNSRFLLDILKIIDDQKIFIDFHGEGGPVIFRLLNDNSYLYLVLPIKKVN